MNKKMKTILLLAVFAVIIGAAAFAYQKLGNKVSPQTDIGTPSKETGEAEKEKMTAPDFTVLNADGEVVKFSDMLGKPIVLNFWASWCPPCRQEMPEFNKVYQELGSEIQFMMVDMVDGQRETMEKGAAYIAEQGFTFPVYFDTEQNAGYTYGIRSYPTTIFIDKDGYIVTGVEGGIDEAALRKGIDLIKVEGEHDE